MTTAVCPCCGFILRQLESVSYGNIDIDKRGDIHFGGQAMQLSRTQHLIVEALVRAKGRGLTRSVLATMLGGDINDETISKYIQRVRTSFRTIDPAFDQIKVLQGFGAYRWAFKAAPRTSLSGGVKLVARKAVHAH